MVAGPTGLAPDRLGFPAPPGVAPSPPAGQPGGTSAPPQQQTPPAPTPGGAQQESVAIRGSNGTDTFTISQVAVNASTPLPNGSPIPQSNPAANPPQNISTPPVLNLGPVIESPSDAIASRGQTVDLFG